MTDSVMDKFNFNLHEQVLWVDIRVLLYGSRINYHKKIKNPKRNFKSKLSKFLQIVCKNKKWLSRCRSDLGAIQHSVYHLHLSAKSLWEYHRSVFLCELPQHSRVLDLHAFQPFPRLRRTDILWYRKGLANDISVIRFADFIGVLQW